ncbi:uncharacterized protein N7518_004805 [Penicillium psychrosexuale]|uniref:uncharacterized protein n=1 Tax=Penicillium psychrosexuale TaxID=1002107 RepID=UPI002545597E|nr:uncharacterized protein N7518_004805 [Penicillium psychrosexuale]KAJ5796265.1 hypothetical protein N7518_004805 [Penicillium psychrosexuale]
MSLDILPTELILMIEKNLHSQKDRNALIRTSARFALMFDEKLYKSCSAQEHSYIILWAAKRGLEGTIRKCLKAGAKIPRRDRFRSHLIDRDAPESLSVIPRHPKSHPLTAAAEFGSLSCVNLFLEKGVNPNLLDEHYETPLRQAAGNGHVNVVELLLSSDALAFTGAFKLRRPLKIAAARGHLPVLKALFSFLGSADRNLTVKDAAQIILYEGLWHSKESVVRYALEQGADVNDENSEFVLRLVQGHKIGVTVRGIPTAGWSNLIPNTLHAALVGGARRLVDLVLASGYDITQIGPILRYAVLRRENVLISKLMNMGVNITSKILCESVCGEDLDMKEFMKGTLEKTMEELGLNN